MDFRLEMRFYDASNTWLNGSSYILNGISLAAFDTWEQISLTGVVAPANTAKVGYEVSALETVNNNYDPYLDDGILCLAYNPPENVGVSINQDAGDY